MNLGTRNIAEDAGIQPDRKADGRYTSPMATNETGGGISLDIY